MKKLRYLIKHNSQNNRVLFALIIGLAGGVVLLLSSIAATKTSWFEAENANTTGDISVNDDQQSSGGSFIRFGSGDMVPADADYVVSPSGNDTNSGTANSPFRTISRAQQAARNAAPGMSSDLVIYIRGGNYRLSSPLTFNSNDSGRNGHEVVYKAWPDEKPVLSGGSIVSGWSSASGGMVKTNIGTGFKTRHLYIDGWRAPRARTSSTSGFSKTSNGYDVGISGMANWRNKSHIEIIGFREWRDYHCGVASISGGSITVDLPCWEWANLSPEIGQPNYIENAYELLDQPGEWYHDRSTGELFYMPRNGESINDTTVIASTGGQLIEAGGINNVRFEGITFAHTGWNEPETSEGYAPIQTNQLFSSDDEDTVPGAVHLSNSTNVTLTGNTFTHLGAGGVNLDNGTRQVSVVGNKFTDISAYAISVGETGDDGVSDTSRMHRDITIDNNYISRIGQEYRDSPGIFLGYVRNVSVQHNEIHNIPYSGITMGWGWGQSSYARDNDIGYNHIYDFTKVLTDSAGVYTLSPQPNTEVHNNYIHDNHDRFGCLYPDEGSANMRWHHNVCDNLDQSSYYTKQWIHIWTPTIRDLVIENNYNDSQTVIENAGTNITVRNNTYVSNDNWPTAARNIMDAAGLEGAYQHLSN